ncbi:sensor histidine kinase [Fimbriimonas ginsengisoli]|uniref:histidine kinase n=1 Tax=Fimbriimonas ginsengisoli Gsoil 348 TaxID=661478 RepID=A0A068NUB9_FIMGI|nr:response regulator [Fimbriimonas ginsengisoli]AIE86375.1 sensory box histidine kinase [Fimbriimonas ginsengisoli Gsoil 348]
MFMEHAAVEVGHRANILLVDDRRENLTALKAVLEPLGERLWFASSGEEALRHLLKEDFALILMDAQMPGMNGFETAELIRGRERTRTVPIIFVTAHSQEEQQRFLSYSVGAVDYLTKPFNPEILRSKVRVFVDLYKANEQLRIQTLLLHESELREAERRQRETQEALEHQHMRDLAEELERRVVERTTELVAANEEMEAFCYSVSHDLRAPLRTVCSTSKMLLEDAADRLTENEREYLERQSKAANRLAELIDNLLQLSRLGRKNMELQQVDISEIATSVAEELKNRPWPSPIDIQIEPNMCAVADPGLIRILLDNAMENACKYSPQGGTITVGSCPRDGKTVFFVRDQGVGFDMQYAEKIFRPFERLVHEHEFEGTGIGLANVSRIIKRHRGSVWVESEPGHGTTLYFTLG